MGRIELRNALNRKFRLESRRKKIKEGRKYWEMLKQHAEGYFESPGVFIDVNAFQKDWLARGSRCILEWYEKIDAEREAIIAKREARRVVKPPPAPKKNPWERFTDWLWSLIKIDIVQDDS